MASRFKAQLVLLSVVPANPPWPMLRHWWRTWSHAWTASFGKSLRAWMSSD